MSRLGALGGIFFGHDYINNATAFVGEDFHTQCHCVGNLHSLAKALGYINTDHGYEGNKWVLPATARLVDPLSYDLIHVLVKVFNESEYHPHESNPRRYLFMRVANILLGGLVSERTPALEQVGIYGFAQSVKIVLIGV